MKFRYVVLLVLVLLAFYMIIGTIERRTDYTPASTIQDYDYTEEIEAVKASKFVFRMQNGPRAALYEADGGAWRLAAMKNIKAYLENELQGYSVKVIS